ncbi:Uracil phosphoribosyltransferase, synthesizes UMP from uracil [Linderina macrospora]|uniref:Uracil phosphoribosyltransferase, synthesizes UMP from uracil n=1 Tax=Linderina macrospora TaxID=4868 RepID=A0ACC1J531_9FUNG|nr:Uracil phosphoribosyltransferase, synthesizes UMP from uracil [Linderina macrospora]
MSSLAAQVAEHPRFHLLPQSNQLKALMTIIRDKNTKRSDFVFYSDRVIRLLVEEGLNYLPVVEKEVTTPMGVPFKGVSFEGRICGVSIMRAGESMEQGLRDVCTSVRIGKVLIQRDERTALPTLYYSKLPKDIADRWVLLLDPMLATGGSAIKCAEVLKEAGVKEDHILFINLICSPEGALHMLEKFPGLQIISAEVDEGMDERKFILPGLGDFGDRYFGTED